MAVLESIFLEERKQMAHNGLLVSPVLPTKIVIHAYVHWAADGIVHI